MKTLRIHYFQHVPFEGIGHIESWAKKNGHQLSLTKFYEDGDLPNLDDIDWLIVMGGPMGVYDEEQYAWLATEKRFIKSAIDAGKVVIGFCLGGQIISSVLGGKVFQNEFKEVGWFPITFSDEIKNLSVFEGAKDLTVFHWHNDTFEVPEGTVHIASSKACRNQAFAYGEKVFAFQFHMETELASLRDMIDNCSDDCIKGGEYVQQPHEMVDKENIEESNQLLELLFNNIASQF